MKLKPQFLITAVLCLTLGAMPAAPAQDQGSWMTKAPIPLARNEVALAAVNASQIEIRPLIPGSLLNNLEKFNFVHWITLWIGLNPTLMILTAK